jgi:RNA polymerase sigma-70 factor (ECF subfamily)
MRAQPESDSATESFESLRPLLFGIAYRMLGSVADAEDVVQESYLRLDGAIRRGARIDSTRAYLAATVTRLAIDHLRSARVRREEYVGLWLPEPLLTDDGFRDGPLADPESDSLSMAFLLLLERLTAVERAVFLLHDVFGFTHDQVSDMVGKTATNTRKIASRARRAIQGERKLSNATFEQHRDLAERFFDALRAGSIEGLAALLVDGAVLNGDGGGKAPQWGTIEGVSRVSRVLGGLGRLMEKREARIELRQINRQPGALMRANDGRLISAFTLEISEGRVTAVRSVVNPDKLKHIRAGEQ